MVTMLGYSSGGKGEGRVEGLEVRVEGGELSED
jgi:hypothetical protein